MSQIPALFSIFHDQEGFRLAFHRIPSGPSDFQEWGPALMSKPFESMTELLNRLASLGPVESGRLDQYSLTEEQLMHLNFEAWAISQG